MSYVQSISADAGGSGTGTFIAFSTNNTAGNTLFFGVRLGGDCTVGVADSQSNTGWVENLHSIVQSDDGSVISLWSCPNCKAGANTVTFTFSASITSRYFVAEYSGLLTSGILDVINGSKQSGGTTTTTPISNAVTPTTTKSLVLGIVTTGGDGGTTTASSGYTLRESANANNRIMLEDKEITATTSQTANFVLTSGQTYIAAIAIYKEAGAAAGAALPQLESSNRGMNRGMY